MSMYFVSGAAPAIPQATRLLFSTLFLAALLAPAMAEAAQPDGTPQPVDSMQAASSPAPGATDPDDDDPDAAPYLHPETADECPPEVEENRHTLTYDYAFGTASDSSYAAAPGPSGTGISHRLTLRSGCYAGLVYEHISSTAPIPDSSLTVDSLALIGYVGSNQVWDFYLGIGETSYHPRQQSYAMSSVFVHVRRHIVWGLSGEADANLPLIAFFTSQTYMTLHPNDPVNNGVLDIALRYDWQHVALRLGERYYQVSYDLPGSTGQGAFKRGVSYLGVTLKY